MRHASLRQTLGRLLFLAAALCAAACGFVLWQTHRAEAALEELQAQVQTQPDPAPSAAPTDPTEEAPAKPEGEPDETPLVFPTALQEKNGDLAAWLRVPGAGIDLPVMLTPNDPEHYLRRGITGSYSLSGTPFFDARCTDPAAADCLVIYGHNLRNGTMFSNLLRYDSAAYAAAHPTLTLALPGQTRTYQVFAALRLDADNDGDLALYDRAGTLDEAQFAAFVRALEDRALYSTGLSPQYGQQLLLLSTCARDAQMANGRMVVVGVRTA